MSRRAPEFDDDDLDYDEGFEDAGEEEEMSVEDRAAMDQAKAQVSTVMGADYRKLTTKDVEDTLWHYFYDIEKSVAYLRKTYLAAPAPKPAPKAAPKKAPEGTHASFFSDMPWLDVPQHRQTTFLEPPRPRGGLLGGSDGGPKMSKLQALAAARKKKTEMKEGAKTATATSTENDMKRLSISDQKKENEKPGLGFAKKQKTIDTRAPLTVMSTPQAPSSFAKTLFGSAPGTSKPKRDVFAMPYASFSAYSAGAFAKPSPDDIVLAAQAKAGKKAVQPAPKAAKGAAKDKAASKESSVTNGVAAMKISDVPPPKSKGLDVIKEFEASASKRSVSFVVAGHVDAGKSTLMGRLLVDLKYVDQRTVDKYRRLAEKTGKQSFALAWVMDQREEERDRGVTIDIATNHFETDTTKFTILDAPGHRDFVPNMIAGASQADFAILVIDGNTGAYEKGLKGQTREHVLLLRSLGVQRLIVAVNKLDMVGWSKDRFDEISQQVGGFLTGLGFLEKHVTFVPISGLNGDNISKPIEDSAASWYSGGSLIDALEVSESTSKRALTKPFRLGISEVFRSTQGTMTISGRVDAGTFQVGDAIMVQPSGETAYIKSIMVDTETQDWAVAGQNVSIALTELDPIHVRVGDIICHAADPISCGDTFTMKAMAFEHLMPMPVDLHRGRLHAPGQIQSMTATLDKATGQILKKKPKVVQPGAVARVVIKLANKVPLEVGQRVVIRSQGETVAAGLLE
ncbi:hypothetical protein CC79DRAFT_1279619 [Sarocladium strictum]